MVTSRERVEVWPQGGEEETTAQEGGGFERVWGLKTGGWVVACLRFDLHLTVAVCSGGVLP